MNNQENTMETKIYAEKFWKGMRGTSKDKISLARNPARSGREFVADI